MVNLHIPPFSDVFFSEFRDMTARAFVGSTDDEWLDSLRWRLESMPDVTVFTIEMDGRWAGFKVGYAATNKRYYSWLGGVDPSFRKQGIAKQLMAAQHAWLQESRFQLVETHVDQDNKAMIQLNLNSGLSVTGVFLKRGKSNLIMQKDV